MLEQLLSDWMCDQVRGCEAGWGCGLDKVKTGWSKSLVVYPTMPSIEQNNCEGVVDLLVEEGEWEGVVLVVCWTAVRALVACARWC
jgi:hypothetical protein